MAYKRVREMISLQGQIAYVYRPEPFLHVVCGEQISDAS